MSNEKSHETMKADLERRIDDDLMEIYLLLENKMKLMKNEMKNDIEEVKKIATGQRGEELDRKKFERLISEYKNLKTRNVRHFRFNSASDINAFGESLFGH